MKGLLKLGILLSSLCYSSLVTASPSYTGPGPAFEPNPGASEEEIEYQKKYRSLLDENAALKDEVCPMCILAVPKAGMTTFENMQQVKDSLGHERFETYKKVLKELVSWLSEPVNDQYKKLFRLNYLYDETNSERLFKRGIKAESYQDREEIPSYKAPVSLQKHLNLETLPVPFTSALSIFF